MGLTARRKKFISEYLVDQCATQAAVRSGYSPTRASTTGWELLQEPEVKSAIDRALDERIKENGITVDRILSELAMIAFSDLSDFVDISKSGIVLKDVSNLPPKATKVLSEASQNKWGQVKIKLHSKIHALELLGKYLNLFKDRIALGGDPDAPPISVDGAIVVKWPSREKPDQ